MSTLKDSSQLTTKPDQNVGNGTAAEQKPGKRVTAAAAYATKIVSDENQTRFSA